MKIAYNDRPGVDIELDVHELSAALFDYVHKKGAKIDGKVFKVTANGSGACITLITNSTVTYRGVTYCGLGPVAPALPLCPLCGSPPAVSSDETYIKCPPCGVSVSCNSPEKAVKAWSKLAGLRAPAKHAPVSPSRRSVETTVVLSPRHRASDKFALDQIKNGVFFFDGAVRQIKAHRLTFMNWDEMRIELELWIDD